MKKHDFRSNLSQQPWWSLAKKHKAGDDDNRRACHSFLNPFLKPIGLDLFKERKGKGENPN